MTVLGVYTATEIPPPLSYTYQDSTGATITAVDSPAWDVTFRFQRDGGTAVEGVADAAAGVASYVWVEGDMDIAGSYTGEFHASNGTNKYVSDPLRWVVRGAVPGGSVPTGSTEDVVLDGGEF